MVSKNGTVLRLTVFFSDVGSGADCYIMLQLPTASNEKARTQTILNSTAPVWNETFYFMIQSQVKVKKNIYRLSVLESIC